MSIFMSSLYRDIVSSSCFCILPEISFQALVFMVLMVVACVGERTGSSMICFRTLSRAPARFLYNQIYKLYAMLIKMK